MEETMTAPKPEILGCIFIGTWKLTKAPNGDLYLEDKGTGKAKILDAAIFSTGIFDLFMEAS
jgi:hypothetical protein